MDHYLREDAWYHMPSPVYADDGFGNLQLCLFAFDQGYTFLYSRGYFGIDDSFCDRETGHI